MSLSKDEPVEGCARRSMDETDLASFRHPRAWPEGPCCRGLDARPAALRRHAHGCSGQARAWQRMV